MEYIMVASIRERVYGKNAEVQVLSESLVMPNWTEIASTQVFTADELAAIFADAPDVEFALELLGWETDLEYWEYNMLTSWAHTSLAWNLDD
jgi:hypothetical protein